MIATLLLQVSLQAPGVPIPPSAAIETVQADPERFHGRRVQLHGWVTSCDARGCSLQSTPHRQAATKSLTFAHDAAADRMLAEWAPAKVVVEVRFDATCSRGDVICLDRASELHDVRLIRVLREGLPPRNEGN